MSDLWTKQELCRCIRLLEQRVDALESAVDSDNQTLSVGTDPGTGATNSITISGGNTIPIVHPPGSTYTENVCNDVTMQTNPLGGTGWWAGWSPVITTNQGTTTQVDWRRIGIATAPSKPTDVEMNIEYGNTYIRQRRNRIYMWWDYRVLVNGGVVVTRTNNRYWYNDERQDTNPDIIDPIDVHIQSQATTVDTRLNVPAGATVEVQGRMRWNINGSQSSAYARVITGLRSRVSFDFDPREFLIPA